MAAEDDIRPTTTAADEQYVYELAPEQLPSEAVYRTVAAATNTEPLELPPLAETIDTDALDRLHGPGATDTGANTTFAYGGLHVTVGGGTVSLHGDLDGTR